MTIRGGGHPKPTMVLTPFLRMGPPPRSFAADAHDCIMVRPPLDLPNTRVWRDDPRPLASSPLIVEARLSPSNLSSSLRTGSDDGTRAATGIFGRRDRANRATVPPAHIAMLTRLTRMEAKTRPARSGAMAVVRSRAFSAEIA